MSKIDLLNSLAESVSPSSWASTASKQASSLQEDYDKLLNKMMASAAKETLDEKVKVTRIMPDGSLMVIELEGNKAVDHHRIKPQLASSANAGCSESAAALVQMENFDFKSKLPDFS